MQFNENWVDFILAESAVIGFFPQCDEYFYILVFATFTQLNRPEYFSQRWWQLYLLGNKGDGDREQASCHQSTPRLQQASSSLSHRPQCSIHSQHFSLSPYICCCCCWGFCRTHSSATTVQVIAFACSLVESVQQKLRYMPTWLEWSWTRRACMRTTVI